MAQFLNMYSVDLQKPTGPQPLRQMVCAGDNAANRIGAIVTSDGGTVSLGGSCVGKVVRADGTTVQLSGTISGNQAYVVLDQASCAIVGQIQVAVCWVSGSNVTTLVIAYGSVVSTQTGSPVQPSTPIPDLTQLLAEIENMRTATAAANAAATGALANFAGAFNETAVYTAGQYVTYTDGKFYRLTADHAANVTWANTSKVAVTTGGELSSLKQVIATENANIMANFAGAFVQANAYPAGTYVTYTDGNLYILPNGHEANATWANTTKTQVSVGGELSDLKSALTEFEDGFHNLNLFVHDAELLYENGYASIDNGKISAIQTSDAMNAYILPVDGSSVYTFTACRFAFLVDSDKETAIGSLLQYVTQIDSTGAAYICFSINKNSYPISTYQCSKGTSLQTGFALPNWFNAAEEAKIDKNGTGQVKPQNIEGVTVTGGNILDDAERLYCSLPGYVGGGGYVNIDNSKALISHNDVYCSFLIPVKPNTHYTANNFIRFAVLLKNFASEGTSPVYYSTVVGSALANINSFDTGEADHIIVSWDYSTYPINTFVISEGNTPTTDAEITLPDWWTGGAEIVKPKYISTTGSLSDGTFLALLGYKQNLRKGERYVFSGDLTTMSELRFGFTYFNVFSASATIHNEFAIDGTYITYKTDGSNANYTNRYEHGLTFANNLQFIFEYLDEGNAKITLISNGMMFSQTLPFVKKLISQVVVRSVGSTLTNCKLSWIPIDIDKDIWMFGDSYFAYSSDRWTYYMQQYGYAQNALIDGWPGEGSVNARNSLMTLIQFGTPKYIVWCMGMNDGSDTDANTPSSDWTIRRDEMLAICNENGITPIFATIPNVPSILHTGKNAWIKASGYRYIDFAAAVGAESAGSTWYSGMLSSDNVHPSESGAKALFARALVDFPEFMLNE